jgi:acetyl-CoA C-acetyltransferase
MHAIIEAVARVRSRAGSFALVSANGGVVSKTSVGVYSTMSTPRRPDRSQRLQREIDERDAPAVAEHPAGWATVETYTVTYGRNGPTGLVIGRLESEGSRFVAKVADGDDELLALLRTGDEPVGQRIHVTAGGDGNRVRMRGPAARRVSEAPAAAPGAR